MRKVRSAQPFSHGYVITLIAFLLLTASPMLGAPDPRTTIQKAAEPVRNEYLIMLNVPASDVPKVATELTKRYGGEVLAVWQLGDTGTARTVTCARSWATSSSARTNKTDAGNEYRYGSAVLDRQEFQNSNDCSPRSH